ncbi:MAG: AAA family ATPase [Candidatus Sulfotelmatobacter sp.]
MQENSIEKAGVTHIWPYNTFLNPSAEPFSDEREADVWEELRYLTFDDDVRGDIAVATHVSEMSVSKAIVTDELKKDDVVYSRVKFWTNRELECNVYRPATPAGSCAVTNALTSAVEYQRDFPAEPARNEVFKKSIAWNLGSKADADDLIAGYKDHDISALVLWEPDEDQHLTHLPMVRKSCPDLPIYIFHCEGRADKYGVEREGGNSRSLWDTQSEMTDEKELPDVIEHVAHEGESTWIFGYAKHGKTWIMLCIVKALLTGEPLFGVPSLKVPRKSKRIIYLCPEATRTSLRFRLKLLGLIEYLYDPITNPEGRLYLRSLSKGPKLNLDNTGLLELAKEADLFIDTAIRYLEGEENSSSDVKVMTEQVLNLLAMGARSMWVAHHSGKAFSSATEITLENCARGSSEFAAALTNAIGVVQMDKDTNLIHFHFIDGRDMEEPAKDMHLQGRPYLSEQGNFQVTENVERFKGRNSKSGPKDDPDRQAKIDFSKTIDGSLQDKADAVNEKFGSKHSKSTVSGWLKEFDSEVA